VTRRSIYHWIDSYCQAHDPAALYDEPRPGRPSLWTTRLQGRLRFLLKQSPDQIGYFAVNWTLPSATSFLIGVWRQRRPTPKAKRLVDSGLSASQSRRSFFT